ncbi:DUF1015 family protein [Nonomuraea sp. NPDC059194]|uniref:DUF1015 family protein n=1 Tax=Nonomuraea sp. NPDC059194 TaxID=3346764 RepID=UPI0036AFE3FD
MASPELPVPDGLVLRPFHGVRFAVDDPAKVTSPPYDLISNGDVQSLLDAHPNNVVRLILPCAPAHPPGLTPGMGHPLDPSSASADPSRSSTLDASGHPMAPSAQATPSAIADPNTSGQPNANADLTGSGISLQPVAEPKPTSEKVDGVAPPARYGQARETLRAWLDTGVLIRDAEPAIYVYEQTGPGVMQRGLIGDIGLAAPERRIILPHENVMPGPVADRLALMSTTQANLEPIFLLYDGGGPATHLVDTVASTRTALVEANTDDGVRHRLWAVTAPEEIDLINADLRDRQALIADGHHRYATYRVLQRQEHAARRTNGPWDFGLALLVDATAYPPDLKAIHRVIPDLPIDEAVARARGSWQIRDFATLADGLTALDSVVDPAFLLAGDTGASHLLTDPDPLQLARAMPTDRSDRWNSLNTSVLTEFVLPRVWGMQDDEQAVRIVHHDAHAAVRQAARTGGTAVILKPLAVDAVLAVAAEGERVPRKSTSFGPKPRTGLVLRTFV